MSLPLVVTMHSHQKNAKVTSCVQCLPLAPTLGLFSFIQTNKKWRVREKLM